VYRSQDASASGMSSGIVLLDGPGEMVSGTYKRCCGIGCRES